MLNSQDGQLTIVATTADVLSPGKRMAKTLHWTAETKDGRFQQRVIAVDDVYSVTLTEEADGVGTVVFYTIHNVTFNESMPLEAAKQAVDRFVQLRG